MKKLIGIVLVLFAVPAFAADVNYNYAQFAYMRADIDGTSEEPDGFGIGGSFEVGESWFVVASFAQVEAEELGLSAELDDLAIGFGYHTPISDNVDFYGTLSWLRSEVSADGFGSFDDDGFGATIGMRGMVSDQVELSGSIGYSDVGDFGDGTAFGVGLIYNVPDTFGLGINAAFGDDVTIYGAGLRLYW